MSLFASFVNGIIGKDGVTENVQLLILTLILAVVWLCLGGMFSFYIYKFKQTPAKAKIYSWPLISTIFALSGVMFVCWVLNLVFYLQAEKIFGLGHADTALNVVIAIFVVGFLAMLVMMVMLWFFIYQMAIGLDDEKIFSLGEKIMYSKITKIIKDEQKGAVYINFLQGKRTYKRQKFRLNTVAGQFILKNAAFTNHAIEIADEDQYFKNVISEQAKLQKDSKTDQKD